MCGRIGNRCIWRVREDDILQPRRPIPATTPAERNPDFEGINPEFVSGTGPEVSFKRSKNSDNFWI